MPRLKTVNHVPPKGWTIEEPDGFELTGASEGQLIQILMRHRKAKGAAITTQEARSIVHAQICERWPYGCTKDAGESETTSSSWKATASRFVTAVHEFVRGGFEAVSLEEANERASVCLSCPQNRISATKAPCATCRKNVFDHLRDAVAKGTKRLLGIKAKTDYDDRLKTCGLCGCDLKLLVHFPISTLKMTPEERKTIVAQAPWCWKVA